jgi:hypothetical protein
MREDAQLSVEEYLDLIHSALGDNQTYSADLVNKLEEIRKALELISDRLLSIVEQLARVQ